MKIQVEIKEKEAFFTNGYNAFWRIFEEENNKEPQQQAIADKTFYHKGYCGLDYIIKQKSTTKKEWKKKCEEVISAIKESYEEIPLENPN